MDNAEAELKQKENEINIRYDHIFKSISKNKIIP